MPIGKIVSSRSHLDYVCQVYQPTETREPPTTADYAFGRFVRLAGEAIGVVFDSLLQNPEFGHFGPRLATSHEARVFTPDLIDEQATLVRVLVLGELEATGARQGVPREVIPVHTELYALDDDGFVRFHRDADDRLQLRYVPLVQAQVGSTGTPLLLSVLDRLYALCPQDRARIGVLRDALSWQATIATVRA